MYWQDTFCISTEILANLSWIVPCLVRMPAVFYEDFDELYRILNHSVVKDAYNLLALTTPRAWPLKGIAMQCNAGF